MKLVQTECMTWFALIWFVGGYGWKNKNKFFSLYYTQFALTLFHEFRLHLSNKNKNPKAFYFVLHSVCTNFVSRS